MIETTQEFIDYARANTVTTSARIIINDKNTKGIVSESGKYAIFEGEGIELNESVCVISETFEIEGWYSDEISDKQGNFSEYVTYNTTVNSSKNKDTYDLNIISYYLYRKTILNNPHRTIYLIHEWYQNVQK